MLHSTIQYTKGVVSDGFCPPVYLYDKEISHMFMLAAIFIEGSTLAVIA